MRTPQLHLTALDCPDPLALATFYSRILELELEASDEDSSDVDWIQLRNPSMPTLAFQRVSNFVAPTWPEGPIPQQLHLEIVVDDLDEGEQLVVRHGAIKHSFQPGTTFRVYLDPVGHPFCLVLSRD